MMQNKFQQCLISAGYGISTNSKGRYIQGLIRLLGGVSSLDFLRDDYMVRLLSNAQLRKERSFTYKQLHQIAQPENATDTFYAQMQMLTAKGLFLRGYGLQCPVCELDTWYSLSDVDEHVTCLGCRFQFQLPLMLSFAYRPNRLLVEALKSGAMTILLTVLWLSEQDPAMEWQTESIIFRDNLTTDIDIAAQIDKDFWIIECKDNFKTTDKALGELIEQLRIGHKVAQDIGANRHLLATLYPGVIPARLADFLKTHQIDLLTRTDLLRIV